MYSHDSSQRTQILARWLPPLFWLVVPLLIAAMLTSDTVALHVPLLANIGDLLTFLCQVTYAILLWQMCAAHQRFKPAAIYSLVSMALYVLSTMLLPVLGNSDFWDLCFSTLIMVLSLVSQFNEYTAYRECLAEAGNSKLAQQWHTLWILTLISCAGPIICIPLLLLLLTMASVLSLLLSLAFLLLMAVTSILKLVYLYRTAAVFRTLAQQDQ